MQTAEAIINAYREGKPLRLHPLTWQEFIEVIDMIKKLK